MRDQVVEKKNHFNFANDSKFFPERIEIQTNERKTRQGAARWSRFLGQRRRQLKKFS